MICFLYGVYYNIRYFRDFVMEGFLASGHEYDETKPRVHKDHWHIFCKRCGSMAAIDVHPSRLKERKHDNVKISG